MLGNYFVTFQLKSFERKRLYLSNLLCACVCEWVCIQPIHITLNFVIFLGLFIFHLFICFHAIVLCVQSSCVIRPWMKKKLCKGLNNQFLDLIVGCVMSGWSCVWGKNAGPMPLIFMFVGKVSNEEWVMIGHSL